jgi:hypothetical protein
MTDGTLDPSIHLRGLGAPLNAGKPELAGSRERRGKRANPPLVPTSAYIAQFCGFVKPNLGKPLKEKDLSFSARGGIYQGIQAVRDSSAEFTRLGSGRKF